MQKYVLTFYTREGGSEVERFEANQRAQKLLADFTPDKQINMLEWVNRVDGNGGYAVLETDRPEVLLRDLTTWNSFLHFQVIPVIDQSPQTNAIVTEGLLPRSRLR